MVVRFDRVEFVGRVSTPVARVLSVLPGNFHETSPLSILVMGRVHLPSLLGFHRADKSMLSYLWELLRFSAPVRVRLVCVNIAFETLLFRISQAIRSL